jgi:hypothetical protein
MTTTDVTTRGVTYAGVRFVNLTPHPITIYITESEKLTIPPSGVVARVSAREEKVGSIGDIPIVKTTFGQVEGLPAPQPGVIYIASLLVLQALRAAGIQRDDILAPNTSPSPLGAIRDNSGNIVGTRSLVTL